MNRVLGASLRLFPLHRVQHFLSPGDEVLELACRGAQVDEHRLAVYVIKDDNPIHRSFGGAPSTVGGSGPEGDPTAASAPHAVVVLLRQEIDAHHNLSPLNTSYA